MRPSPALLAGERCIASRQAMHSHVALVVERFARQHHLSPRETTVIQLAAVGVHRKEAAARLRCGLSTIDTYWRRILRKTCLTSQLEVLAALLCYALGDPEPAPRPCTVRGANDAAA